MAVTSKEFNSTSAARTIVLPRTMGFMAYLITFVLAALAIYVLVGAVVGWLQVRIDDVRYGRPRTTHLQGYVGHGNEAANQPTHFIGLNIDRQVTIVEIPAGDPSQIRNLAGPYLFGADQDLTPVLLSLRDMDNDGMDDLIVNVRNEQIVYLNRDGSFRLPSPEEQQLLVQEPGS